MKKIYFSTLIVLSNFFVFSQSLTYKDVAGIFYARCTSCHHTGGNSYSFMNFTEVNAYKILIQNAVANDIMPPWKADTNYTRFRYERLISSTEKSMILNWISSGAAKGDTTQAPPAPVYPLKYKLKGNADLTLTIPTFTSFATSSDIYVCFSMPTNLPQDRIIRAFEIVPGNPQIVHHAVITVDSTNTYNSNLSGSCYAIPGNYELGGYAPGSQPIVFPSQAPLKAGIRVKANSRIIMQTHYPKGTSGQVDSSKIRLYFYPPGEQGVRLIDVSTPLQNWNMYIPAQTTQTFVANYPSATSTFTTPYSLFGVFPHSHLLGKSMWLCAINPGVDTIPMIKIPQWDFEWQDYYLYKKLVKVPAGYRLFAMHVFDNTSGNPNNPSNPPVTVVAGVSTTDEMLFDGIMSLPYQTGDELIDIEAIVALDTLMVNGVRELEGIDKPLITMGFPNPFNKQIEIRYLLNKTSLVKLSFTDLLGREITSVDLGKQDSGVQSYTWKDDIAELPAGVYFYTLQVDDRKVTKRVIKD